jgi:hypothetical protein
MSQHFEQFTPDWLRNYQMKTARQHNAELVGEAGPITDPCGPLKSQLDYPTKRVRQSAKPLMNKLETEFYERIKDAFPNFPPIRIQAKTYRIANGLRYTPDFTASPWPANCGPARETAWEVKGPWATEDSIVKLKAAAATFPEVCWLLVWKDSTGQWNEQRILP